MRHSGFRVQVLGHPTWDPTGGSETQMELSLRLWSLASSNAEAGLSAWECARQDCEQAGVQHKEIG